MDNTLKQIIENANHDVYEGYSGRGMFGRECTGVTFSGTQAELIADLIESASELNLMEDLPDMLRNARTDTLGRDTIMYFPNY